MRRASRYRLEQRIFGARIPRATVARDWLRNVGKIIHRVVATTKSAPPACEVHRRLIRDADAGKLNFSEKGVDAFPEIPAGTTAIDGSDNKLTALPASIATCKDTLGELLLFKNKIKTVDAALAELGQLTTLNLFNNQIGKV